MSVYNYYEGFVRMSKKAKECAYYLNNELKNFDKSILESKIDEIHAIEHESDEIKHEIMENLVKEFLPPIEREDIMIITHYLDNVTDNLEEVLINLYILNIDSITDKSIAFSELIIECVETMHKCLEELHNFKKSKILLPLIISVNTIEEKGDVLYLETMNELYRKNTDPIYIMAWSKIYDLLEKCLDSCESVADELEVIILKNS
ncbi:DUF47 domain-containing protein [Miniphocaeibacter halophilus]|uniref:DUF47 family protein n=1 Tax=Miniphocaeibacter halophilus TaxID=2931922 RepID=A0AC61MVU9_9FIRM|nr:DUF47 family protein [Miniphocaeibacter halophilus]QQK07916.1 DUF47 family protein [Miniphocaeibacter halophilus]